MNFGTKSQSVSVGSELRGSESCVSCVSTDVIQLQRQGGHIK